MLMPAVHPQEKRCLHTYRGWVLILWRSKLDQKHLNLICQHFDLWQAISVDGLKWWNDQLLLIRGHIMVWREGLSEGNSGWTFPTTGHAVTGTQSNYQSNYVPVHQCLGCWELSTVVSQSILISTNLIREISHKVIILHWLWKNS